MKELLVTSEGARFASPKAARRLARKLAREQRRLARKEKGSSNRAKQRTKVARVHERIADARRDALHKATTRIARKSQAVAVEDLSVKGMQRNRRLSFSVTDAAMGEALRMLEWKCAEHRRAFAKVARSFPSTRLCSCCGAKAGPMGAGALGVRSWECPECGASHYRDVNAARNIAAEGGRLLGLDGTAEHAGTAAA